MRDRTRDEPSISMPQHRSHLRRLEAMLKIYGQNKVIIQTAKITSSKETALYVIISHNIMYVVKELLKIIDDLKIEEINNDKETLLHPAALLGKAKTCMLLVEKDMELIRVRNKEGETPLFIAKLLGKEAFYALHPKCLVTYWL